MASPELLQCWPHIQSVHISERNIPLLEFHMEVHGKEVEIKNYDLGPMGLRSCFSGGGGIQC